MGRSEKLGVAACDMVAASDGRSAPSRCCAAGGRDAGSRAQVAEQASRIGARHVLHTGTFDLPACDLARA